ncbi:T6SS effector amidase Tae4 family protein [Alkalimonas sp. MEB108]|uniref:T6SS effector amidase Tae4 family protein n=1 Tax=Alkalimonas cellulosilytica TaxID=3058395 RepID=A0ABU7J0K3_9GAMM|nr:T6SS effector amidase Tae4 family protein [Alkalimonas sp. MEB108]MEE1999944.1 T6SS effector amidase Tae4 family protein [Alkalimonas sp. MEB108]
MSIITYQAIADAYEKYNAFNTAELYRLLGWDDLIGRPEWANTCAVRMSLALLEAGMNVTGRVQIKQGDLKGRWVEPGQNRLSDWLVRQLGQPEVFPFDSTNLAGPQSLYGKKGIISFMRIPSYSGGHIDLLHRSNDYLTCSRSCYFTADEVRFWALS